ncbi:MAG: hypothetical protein ACRCX2_17475 [Paraclostridium sp.]
MSPQLENLKGICKDKGLTLKRKESLRDRKLGNGYDGVGELLHFKSRKINYDFELSFCKLPKYLRKISKDQRESFERKYNYDSYISLLCRKYRIPKLVEKNPHVTGINITGMKKSYSKLIKFMEGYWNISDEDKIITPKLMEELKTANVTFFKSNKN